MKKKLLLLVLGVLGALGGYAQWKLDFCANDSAETCIGKSDIFYWNGETVTVYLIVNHTDSIGASKLRYRVYDMKGEKSGEVYADLRVYTRPAWKRVWKKIYFVKPGYYKVEVYDEHTPKPLVSGFVTITDRKD